MDAPWQPYIDGDPACQPQHLHLDATTPPERQPTSIPPPVPSLLSALFLGELHRGLVTPPELSSSSLAKPACQKLCQCLLHLDVTSIATVEHG